MEVIDNDYLRYILHVEAVQQPAAEPDLDRAVYAAAEDPVAETNAMASALLADQGANVPGQTSALAPSDGTAGNGRNGGGQGQIKRPNAPDALVPIVKEQHEKIGRNEPCWCGSGKKFKLCHGAA
jgi:preprotein translocase subunit SecA